MCVERNSSSSILHTYIRSIEYWESYNSKKINVFARVCSVCYIYSILILSNKMSTYSILILSDKISGRYCMEYMKFCKIGIKIYQTPYTFIVSCTIFRTLWMWTNNEQDQSDNKLEDQENIAVLGDNEE
ncbi:uncharacterized protein LOC109610632 isoform X2 [Ooceraea biroi]|uniref:uncharacterized protein LOC109610632 isoform X2 n=1 Tax=Ooceraea biroi TaxID=2015173 RepID=UPI0005BA7C88|nr:uncharacterized protein LOC109610632 isoform X2 [Ooceraea biroi]